MTEIVVGKTPSRSPFIRVEISFAQQMAKQFEHLPDQVFCQRDALASRMEWQPVERFCPCKRKGELTPGEAPNICWYPLSQDDSEVQKWLKAIESQGDTPVVKGFVDARSRTARTSLLPLTERVLNASSEGCRRCRCSVHGHGIWSSVALSLWIVLSFALKYAHPWLMPPHQVKGQRFRASSW